MVNALSSLFSAATKINGRFILGVAIVLYFIFWFVLQSFIGYQAAWFHVEVPAMFPPFADLRNITSAVDCQHAGYDPLVNDPCDPWHRPMNYPRIWLILFSAIHAQQNYTVLVGFCLAAAFYVSLLWFVGAINAYEGGLYAVLVCSPAAMLAVERGNNDLIIFILLSVALLTLRQSGKVRWFSYLLIGFCSLLKLYPFFAYLLAVRERPRLALGILLTSFLLFVLYLLCIKNDLREIASALPRSYSDSYGSHVLFDRLQAAHLPVHAKLASLLAALGVAGAADMARRRTPSPVLNSWNSESLLASAALYTGTFAFGNNWNYRLIFLLFAVPALLQLAGTKSYYTRYSLALLAALVVSFWLAPNMDNAHFLIKQIANWMLFAGLLVLLFHLLHDRFLEIKNKINFRGLGNKVSDADPVGA